MATRIWILADLGSQDGWDGDYVITLQRAEDGQFSVVLTAKSDKARSPKSDYIEIGLWTDRDVIDQVRSIGRAFGVCDKVVSSWRLDEVLG